MNTVQKPPLLQVAIVEDDPADAAILHGYLERSGYDNVGQIFCSAGEFLQNFRPGRYDLIFLDIYMDHGAQGIEAAEKIRRNDPNVVIAFVTNSPDHTREAFRLSALAYLDKPITAEGVKNALSLAQMKRKSRPVININQTGGGQSEIPRDSIVYCEQKGHVVEIQLTDGIISTNSRTKLGDLEKMLPAPPFIRCHHSFIVNYDYVSHIDRHIPAFCMENQFSVPIRQRDAGKCAQYEREIDEWITAKIWRDEL